MASLKVGCSGLTGEIFAGTVSKNNVWGRNKTEVTDSAVSSVAQHLVMRDESLYFTYKGKRYVLKVEEVKE